MVNKLAVLANHVCEHGVRVQHVGVQGAAHKPGIGQSRGSATARIVEPIAVARGHFSMESGERGAPKRVLQVVAHTIDGAVPLFRVTLPVFLAFGAERDGVLLQELQRLPLGNSIPEQGSDSMQVIMQSVICASPHLLLGQELVRPQIDVACPPNFLCCSGKFDRLMELSGSAPRACV